MFKKQIDDMGGPGFGPYKKMLAQGMEGPANRYTWGQVTTPAERYHLDRLGKLAELGGFSFEKAFGGRVPFGKGGMSRRRFLEIIGGLAGGAAVFKTGLLSIIKGSKGKVIQASLAWLRILRRLLPVSSHSKPIALAAFPLEDVSTVGAVSFAIRTWTGRSGPIPLSSALSVPTGKVFCRIFFIS